MVREVADARLLHMQVLAPAHQLHRHCFKTFTQTYHINYYKHYCISIQILLRMTYYYYFHWAGKRLVLEALQQSEFRLLVISPVVDLADVAADGHTGAGRAVVGALGRQANRAGGT